tara:strand:- start:5804 stop:6451 length:648 start_codon:yes stop_codon:yes gene_type:complete
MYNGNNNGDSIAQEFLKLLGDSPGFQKEAKAVVEDAMEDYAKEQVSDLLDTETVNLASQNDALEEGLAQGAENAEKASQSNEASDASYANDNYLADMFVKKTPRTKDSNSNMLDDQISSFSSKKEAGSKDSSDSGILKGLNKIATNLRAKGENFAADVVLSTALSIKSDIEAESKRAAHVYGTLSKVASDLDSSGDRFAGDMVRATLFKLQKSSK